MKTPLVNIQIPSIYTKGKQPVLLPDRLARCTPDMYRAVLSIQKELKGRGGELILSDLYRSYDVQKQANLDYLAGRKTAYSPPPGGSMHEAGRAMDIDLSKIKVSLAVFQSIARKYGVTPIINQSDAGLKEAWHFDCRGSHGRVYDYYKKGKARNMLPYEAMTASAILSLGQPVDRFGCNSRMAFIQSGLIRLGYDIGEMDGCIGPKTNAALKLAGIGDAARADKTQKLEGMLRAAFPEEYGPVG